MCKYCDSLKENSLISYDNYKSMNVSFGQYRGVNVYGNIYMKGNMLSISCGGSYRSDFDCYAESEGLDIDNEYASNSEQNYIQISYCPFCGRKLDSNVYEKQKANDDIKKLKEKLKWLEQDYRDNNLIVTCSWYCNKRINNGQVGTCIDREEIDYIKYNRQLTLTQISEVFPKVILKVYYGHKSRNKYITQEYPSLTLDTKIKSLDYCWGTYYSDIYKLSDEMYFKLIELGYIEHNEEKYNELKKRQKEIFDNITQIKKNIKQLNKYLNTLNKMPI